MPVIETKGTTRSNLNGINIDSLIMLRWCKIEKRLEEIEKILNIKYIETENKYKSSNNNTTKKLRGNYEKCRILKT